MGNVDYKELPLQKRIQIDQKIVAKKRKIIDKIAKKLLRGLKAGEVKNCKSKRSYRKMRKLSEARGDTAVFTFGRFNPPTTGHEKLITGTCKSSRCWCKDVCLSITFPKRKERPTSSCKKDCIYEEDVSKIFKEYYY